MPQSFPKRLIRGGSCSHCEARSWCGPPRRFARRSWTAYPLGITLRWPQRTGFVRRLFAPQLLAALGHRVMWKRDSGGPGCNNPVLSVLSRTPCCSTDRVGAYSCRRKFRSCTWRIVLVFWRQQPRNPSPPDQDRSAHQQSRTRNYAKMHNSSGRRRRFYVRPVRFDDRLRSTCRRNGFSRR